LETVFLKGKWFQVQRTSRAAAVGGGSVLLIKELIKVVACSGLLTLPVVVINKGSCKTLGCWQSRSEREPWLALLDNGDGGIHFPPMLLCSAFHRKDEAQRVDFVMKKIFLLILVRIQVYLEIGSPWEESDWIRWGQVGLGWV
jgi:hypothetical protein